MFVIRQKSTDWFLPNARGRSGRGFTHVEPVPMSREAPRLFHRRQDAQVALKWWLKGKLTVTACSTSWETPDILDDEDWSTEPVPERQADDMEIVEVMLVVK